MAITPTWLNFPTPTAVLSDVAAANARQQALALQAQEQAAQQALAQQQLAQRAALASLENESSLMRLAQQQQLQQQQLAQEQANDVVRNQMLREQLGLRREELAARNQPFDPRVISGLNLPDGIVPVQVGPERVEFVTDPTRPKPLTDVDRQRIELLKAQTEAAKKKLEEGFKDPLLKDKFREMADVYKNDLNNLDKTPAKINAGIEEIAASLTAPRVQNIPPVQSIPQIRTQAEYDALASGSRYLDPNGVERTKR